MRQILTQAKVEDPTKTIKEYTVLAPLPGTTKNNDNRTADLQSYIPGLFNLMIGLAAVLAVGWIIWGGIEYITTDSWSGKQDGKTRIWNAIRGLFIVICAWLILYTINPNLLTLNLNIKSSIVTGPKVTLGGEASAGTGGILPWYPLTSDQIAMNNAMRSDLDKNYDIKTKNGPCTTPGVTTGCTNLVGMLSTTYKGVTDLKSVCNCNITINGGTEGGHASHGPNLPPIDLGFDPKLDKYIYDNRIKDPIGSSLGVTYTSKVGDRNATFLKESDHWHVVFE